MASWQLLAIVASWAGVRVGFGIGGGGGRGGGMTLVAVNAATVCSILSILCSNVRRSADSVVARLMLVLRSCWRFVSRVEMRLMRSAVSVIVLVASRWEISVSPDVPVGC